MKKYINKILEQIKSTLRKIYFLFRNPGIGLADLLYKIFRRDRDKIPLPLFRFILKYYGPWAGVSIYMANREYWYRLRWAKFKRGLEVSGLILLLSVVVGYSLLTSQESFFFGFAQNLLADIILILLAIYFLPRILNRPKDYKVALSHDFSYVDEHKYQITINIKNTGSEVFRKGELSWRIYIPIHYCDQDDITIFQGNFAEVRFMLSQMWEISGDISSFFFIDQKEPVVQFRIRKKANKGSAAREIKLYYQLRTLSGNQPTIEDITKDFLNTGVPIDEYPMVGDLVVGEI